MILFNVVLENMSPVREAEMGRPDGEISFPIISITNSFVDYGTVSFCTGAAAIF
jgi:tRNA(Phe) wybutosine-synthesizing methylase Tyw3